MDPVGHTQGFSIAELSEEDGEPVPSKFVHVDVCVESGGLRIIMDPFREDHDILLMPWANGWSIVVHPHGEDPVFTIRMTNTEATVVDDWDRLLGKAEDEPNRIATCGWCVA